MADDDGLISAMWHSLVPTFEYGEGAGGMESSAVVDHRNPDEGMGVRTYYAEAEQDHLIQIYPDIEPVDDWNPQEVVEDYAKAACSVEFLTEDEASADMQRALAESLEIKDIYCLEDQEMAGYLNQLIDSTAHDSPNFGVETIKEPHLDGALFSNRKAEKRIYKVPNAIRKGNKDYYDPQYISIGPYHYGSTTTQAAEWDKHKFFINLRLSNKISWAECKPKIKEVLWKVEDYYADLNLKDSNQTKTDSIEVEMNFPKKEDTVEKTSNEVAELMFRDACFILAQFHILQWSKATPESNSIKTDLAQPYSSFTRDDYWNVPVDLLIHDICLIENQMPFFIVQIVYDMCRGKDTKLSLRHQIVEYIQKKILKPYPTAILIHDEMTDNFEHILHYCHMCFTPKIDVEHVERDPNNIEFNQWRRAMVLYDKGIRFKSVSKKNAQCLLDIKFDNGVLRIPTLVISHHTTFLFANILAFEQSNQYKNYFSAYVKFMAELMTTSKDITLLTKKRIIETTLGKDDEVLDFFNALKKGTSYLNINETYLRQTFSDLEKYYKVPSTQYWTDLRRNYCKNPWMIIGVMVAAILLLSSATGVYFNFKGHQ